MIVQSCLKGIHGIGDAEAQQILTRKGIQCNWWRRVQNILPEQKRQKLTASAIDLHVNNYASVINETPFISLTSGCVTRDEFLRTNVIFSARNTAVEFATDGGLSEGYVFYCWLIVGLKAAPEVEGICEEVRELNTYRNYSAYQTEGEIAAKIIVPSNQIKGLEKIDATGRHLKWIENPNFTSPSRVTNYRGMI